MGILNVTPDSFSDGGLYFDDIAKAVAPITKCHSRRLATILPELRALFGGTPDMTSVSGMDDSPGQSKRIRDTAHRLNDESDMLI